MSASADPWGWRTSLFVPADRPEMLARAQERGADAIVVDLEDAIAPEAKQPARESLRALLDSGSLVGPAAILVRLNAVEEGFAEDLETLAGATIEAFVLPKASDAAQVRHAAEKLRNHWEHQVGLVPQVESVAGILAAPEILRVEGLVAIAFGGEDFCVDLGVSRSGESLELLLPRAQLGLLARAANLPAIDTVYTAIEDEGGLIREARTARQLGFAGKLLIHPRQVEPVRDVFAPGEDELVWARRVLAVREESDELTGVTVVDGRMVDAPVIAQAQRILARGG